MAWLSGNRLAGVLLLLVVLGVVAACPSMLARSSSRIQLGRREVNAAPGEAFTLDVDLRQGASAGSSRDARISWAFQGTAPGGRILEEDAKCVHAEAPSVPGTYSLVGRLQGLFGERACVTVRVVGTGGVFGPALGLVSSQVQGRGPVRYAWAMDRVREGCSALRLRDGSILITGGWESLSPRVGSSAALRYWPGQAKATSVGPMCRLRADHQALLLHDGRVLLAGGNSDGDIEIFDPTTESFELLPGVLPEGGGFRVALLASGDVLVYPCVLDLEAVRRAPDALPVARVLDPATGRTRPVGRVALWRALPTLTSLPDGRVLIIGGSARDWDGAGGSPGRAHLMSEVYLPDLQAFAGGPGLSRARLGHRAVALVDGRVLVYGGLGPAHADDDPLECIDPRSGTVSTVEVLKGYVALGQALGLKDGSVIGFDRRRARWLQVGSPVSTWLTAPHPLPAGHAFCQLADGRVLVLGGAPADCCLFFP